MSLLTTVVPALLPVVSDGIRGLFNMATKSAGAKPANVQEAVQLIEAETERLRVLAELDSVGNVSPWVNDVRGMQRPVAAALVLLAWGAAYWFEAPAELTLVAADLASAVVFYLFGDRTYMHLRRQG